jgi:hypothetical protein
MTLCPCCSKALLRHVRGGQIYLFCTHCRQEMPDLELMALDDAAIAPSPKHYRPVALPNAVALR